MHRSNLALIFGAVIGFGCPAAIAQTATGPFTDAQVEAGRKRPTMKWL